MLEGVSPPIREYLKQRADTVRCVVSSLIGHDEDPNGGGSEPNLLAELQCAIRAGPAAAEAIPDGVHANDDESDVELNPTDQKAIREGIKWEPDPVDDDLFGASSHPHAGAAGGAAGHHQHHGHGHGGAAGRAAAGDRGVSLNVRHGMQRAKRSRAARTADVISMLVDIFGDKEVQRLSCRVDVDVVTTLATSGSHHAVTPVVQVYVMEYRALLAERLLRKQDYDTSHERMIFELLSLRFGESALHYCEVLLAPSL